jgi:hypothetical protein
LFLLEVDRRTVAADEASAVREQDRNRREMLEEFVDDERVLSERTSAPKPVGSSRL